MNRNRPITKTDVARAIGVSHMTVTRVLHDSTLVREATRKRVLAACRRLNYRPNLIAASLRMRKSHVFGVVVPSLSHSYFARLISAVESKAGASGYHILVTQILKQELQHIDQISFLLGQRIEGVFIAMRRCGKPVYDCFKSGGIPIVFLDNPGPKGAVFIGTEDYQGGFKAAAHLIGLGHRRIAHITGPTDHYTARQRLQGYLAALKAHGIRSDKNDVIFTNFQSIDGYQAAERLFQAGAKHTAVFCANDYLAVGFMSWAYNHGIKVPEQMSVIGFTGDEIGQYSAPPLTTMVQHTGIMGIKAVEQMLALIEGRRVCSRILVPPELLVRGSTSKIQPLQ